ncbi:MAG: Ig-like domain-containing protein [Bacteroidales bacterium]|nr:Ig-like domain-containing protein [Bacteroidales bacterium]
MKKHLTQSYLISIVIFSAILASCNSSNPEENLPNPDPVAVTGIRLSHATASLDIGETLVLSATISPWNATNRAMTWSSSDTTIVYADSNRIQALSPGTANIVVETQDGNKTDTTVITVLWPNVEQGCNRNTPGWGASLGTVGFVTTQEWPVGNQIWSDAVTATGCDKTNFYGGSNNNFNADCRSNPGFPGDLFSWCAVIRFQAELCPTPWRVPTIQDFRDLDTALGGSGMGNLPSGDTVLRDMYIYSWGVVFGGASDALGNLPTGNRNAHYWSQTDSPPWAASWVVAVNGRTGTASTQKSNGLPLRCVRNNN